MKIIPSNRFDNKKFINLRVAKGINLVKLAEELDVSLNTIWEIETIANRSMSAEIVFRYCDYFKVSILELMTDEQLSVCSKNLAEFLLFHEVIDDGTAEGIINFYKR
jgi:transcriptional regulator with XRE-family HTH domain